MKDTNPQKKEGSQLSLDAFVIPGIMDANDYSKENINSDGEQEEHFEELPDDIKDDLGGEQTKPDSKEEIKKTEKKTSDGIRKLVDEDLDGDDNDVSQDDFDITPLVDLVSEKFGLEIPEDGIDNNMEGFLSYLEKAVQEKSKPTYSSDYVRDLDEFVKNGGDPEDFISKNQMIDFDNIDLSDETNQRYILEDYYKMKGFSDIKAKKLIDKSVDSGDIEEDALDAVEELKQMQEAQKKRMIEEQKAYSEKIKEDQKTFVSNAKTYVEKLDEFAGMKITKTDKEKLLPFVFEIGKDGKTAYQREYEKDPIKFLVGSALVTLLGDNLKSKVKGAAKEDMYNDVKKVLRSASKSRSANFGTEYSMGTEKEEDLFRDFERYSKKIR
jgi:hypothetical protein